MTSWESISIWLEVTKGLGLVKDVRTSRLFSSLSRDIFGIDAPKAMKEKLNVNSFFKRMITMNTKMINISEKITFPSNLQGHL